jgi:flagellar biosynthesis protein FlhG
MKDQAQTLRRIVKNGDKSPQVISVTSGKGGVGKTTVVTNMAILLASLGKKVLVFDADLGLANIDVMLGLTPRYNIKHVLDGQCRLDDIILKGPQGIKIIPASSGVQELVDLSHEQQLSIMNTLDYFDDDLDYMLLDTGAGISRNVMYFNTAAQRIVVVVTPEPTSITDAYALIKVLRTKHGIKRFDLIINNVLSAGEGNGVAKKLMMVCDRFLGDVALDMLGSLPHDSSIPECIRAQKAFVGVSPAGEAARRLSGIVKRLEQAAPTYNSGNIQFFFRRLLLNQGKVMNHAGHSVSGSY